jgi:putative glutamine amidotransferase
VPKPPIVAVTATSEPDNPTGRVRVNQAYTDAIAKLGMIPLVVPPMAASQAGPILDLVDGLFLTGGEDIDPSQFGAEKHPQTGDPNVHRDEIELALTREAARRKIPTLAVCRGVQVLNVALGGTLVQDIPSERGTSIDHDAESKRSIRVHPVEVTAGSRLAGIISETSIATNSFHHQSADRVGAGLIAVAKSPDGVIEALECSDRGWWAIGVQWHPEELINSPEEWDRRLFAAFAEAVRARR